MHAHYEQRGSCPLNDLQRVVPYNAAYLDIILSSTTIHVLAMHLPRKAVHLGVRGHDGCNKTGFTLQCRAPGWRPLSIIMPTPLRVLDVDAV